MDLPESVALGGMLIVHKLQEGKHEYQVENVVRCRKSSGETPFARKGDRLVQVNDTDLQDLTPEELAQLIAEGNPKLTIHKSCKDKESSVQAASEGEDVFYPVSKTAALLTFDMEMTREDEQREDESARQEGGPGEAAEEELCSGQREDRGVEQDLFIVSMMKTRISVLRARCGDGSCGCVGCPEENCSLNDVIVVSESSKVTLVSRGSESFRLQKLSEKSIQHFSSKFYIRGLCSPTHTSVYASPNPESITIYYYKSREECPFRGMPVVLNFTGSNCYLRCLKGGHLKVDTSTKQNLQKISKSDPDTLSFLFYMKSDLTGQRKFESALYGGWFIRILDTKLVDVAAWSPPMEEKSFLFIIQSI